MTQKPMHIVYLEVDSYKRIRAVRIEPRTGQPLIRVGGRNRQGKSSLLDSIAALLGGKSLMAEQPVRKGAKKAVVEARVGPFVIRRSITEKGGGSLTVFDDAGKPIASPQTFLDGLLGKYTVEPMRVLRCSKDEQVELVRRAAGIETADLDAKRAASYDERTSVNRQLSQLDARLASAPHPPEAPNQEVSLSALSAEYEVASQARQAANDAHVRISRARGLQDELAERIRTSELTIATLRRQLGEAEAGIASHRSERANADQRVAELLHEAERLTAAAPDLDPIRQRMANIEAVNRKARENLAHQALTAEVGKVRDRSRLLTRQIEDIDMERLERIRSAAYPVPGLLVDDAGVTYRGVPLAQASSAEQLRVAVALALAPNPAIRVLVVREGSLLDNENMGLLAELAEEHQAQVWVEVVTEGEADGATVTIEDGEVLGS